MNKGTKVVVHFPDGEIREGWYHKSGSGIWHRIKSKTSGASGWWCLAKPNDLGPWFEERS